MNGVRTGGWLSTKPAMRDTLARLSWDAEAVWHKMRLYCAAVGNDGVLPHDELHVAMDRKIPEGRARKTIPELVRLELLTDRDGTYILDWSEQPSAEVWNDPVKRERWARDKRLKRDAELCRRIKTRDRNLCRYCGIRVDWNVRTGPAGGTYDHIDPDGDNDFDNVAVACRRCNGRKRDRTPLQAGMTLFKPGTTAEQIAEAARGPTDRPTPGQPPADPRPTAPSRTHARPDQANPGPAPGQPDPTPGTAGQRRAPAPEPVPPHTDEHAPPEEM